MGTRIFVAVALLVTLAYCWGLGWIAWGFARAGGAVGWGLAIGIAIFVALTVWVIWREMLFGIASGRLARRYRTEDRDAPTAGRAGEESEDREGRLEGEDREARTARRRAEFEAARSAIEEGAENDWRAWFRLALAYDALRDRRAARASVRRAIDLEGRPGTPEGRGV